MADLLRLSPQLPGQGENCEAAPGNRGGLFLSNELVTLGLMSW